MKDNDETLTPVLPLKNSDRTVDPTHRLLLFAAGLTLCFGKPLFDLIRFALGSELFSHIILIPFISAYLIRQNRNQLPKRFVPDPVMAAVFAIAGLSLLAGFWLAILGGTKLAREDSLVFTTLSYLLLLTGLTGWFLGRETLRSNAFPIAFLACMIPLPVFAINGIETFLQHGSAEVAHVLLKIAGTPVFREDLVFQLPGIILQVAPECSGIHSTLALFITSLLAGHFFLNSPVKRGILAVAVIPLALLRNGVRIFTISELCVHISPDMIHSYIHRKGGPIFFALSLIPFFIFLIYLRRSDRLKAPVTR